MALRDLTKEERKHKEQIQLLGVIIIFILIALTS
jgi:hypothetical protein